MYETHLLTDVDCRSMWEHGKKTGYCVNIRINYYRGLPISCVDEISLEVDGEKIAPEDMSVQLHGYEFPYPFILSDNAPTDIYWRHGELMRVIIHRPGGIRQGRHHVKLTLGTRRSYTPTMVDTCEKDLTFA